MASRRTEETLKFSVDSWSRMFFLKGFYLLMSKVAKISLRNFAPLAPLR